MSVQDLLAVEITPARMQLAKEPRLALGPPGVGFDRSDRTVSEYGPTALFEDLAEAVGIDPDAFARELATRQTIDTIGARIWQVSDPDAVCGHGSAWNSTKY